MAKAKKTEENATTKRSASRAKNSTAAAPAEAKTPISIAEAKTPISIEEEQVRLRAYELYLERNGDGGTPEEDWYRAEAELRGKSA